ncbi:MAG: hypothetical protein AB9880_10890 [Christensenellales bacterium]
MSGETIFQIQRMEELPDCFRSPVPSCEFTAEAGLVRGWPSFHASPADPEGGYREHAYAIRFPLPEAQDCLLKFKIYVSTPRYPDVRITVNGWEGFWYPLPRPCREPLIRPSHALHASIYNVDEIALLIPAGVLQEGLNRLTLTAVDEEPFEREENPQAVLRLDRMADACGFHYASLSLEYAGSDDRGDELSLRPEVCYLQAGEGLVEKCSLVFTPMPGTGDIAGALQLTWAEGSLTLPLSLARRPFGQYRLPFLLPDGEGPVRFTATGALQGEGSFLRRRKWKVYTTPHAHTDIGYTHRQAEVMERMSRNVDTALALLSGPQREAFSYILDSSWALEDYAQTRDGARMASVLRETASGKIGIPGNYVDLLTWFASLEELIHNGDFTQRLLRPAGLKADRVDIVDVASATWSLPSLLSGMGIKYLLHANNQDRGPFRLNGGLHRCSPFWWQGPDGGRVLTWLARMYCELKKVCGSPGSLPAARRGLDIWLMDYEREDYAPDAVLLYGQEADNTDLDIRMAAFCQDWGREVAYPRLIPSDGSSFFEYLLTWADSFPTFSGDEGAYWEDGAAASARESFLARKAQAALKAAETLESFAALLPGGLRFPGAQYSEAWRWLLLYDEHTWGSFMSGSDPHSLLQQAQWRVKANMAYQAADSAEALLTRAAARLSLQWNNQGRELVVYNPCSFPLTDLVETEFSPGETLCDSEDRELAWVERGRSGTLLAAQALIPLIPPLAYRRFPLKDKGPCHRGGASLDLPVGEQVILANAYYEVTVDTRQAVIVSLLDKTLQRQLSGGALGAVLYAQGGENTTLLGNHPEYRQEAPQILQDFSLESATFERSAVGERLSLQGKAAFGGVSLQVFLPSGLKRLDLHYEIDKQETARPEALYIDFPFMVKSDASVLSDTQTGWVDWSRDVLPGACREWLPLQTSMLLRGDDLDIQIASPNAFLFAIGQPVQGLWTSQVAARDSRLLSYVLNNYWRTNYPVLQGGKLSFSYALTSQRHIPFEAAFAFGWARRQGLFAQRMSYQAFRQAVPPALGHPGGGTLMQVQSDHIFLNTLRGSDWEPGAFLARLIEAGGRAGSVSLRLPGLLGWRAADHQENPAGERLPAMGGSVTLAFTPWQVRSVLLYFA